jgi:CheY-like chemotaxis protein
VQKARELQPALITLDVMMPEKDGWSVIQDLKNDPETADIPVIICSILEEKEKGLKMGADAYLVKPFLKDELVNAIRQVHKNGKQ